MSYENPRQLYTGIDPASAYLEGFQKQSAIDEKRRKELEAEQERKRAEEQRLIEKMQRVQGDADVWNLEQMNKLATAPKTSAIQDELMKTLNDRIDIATQAQIYLKTQFGDQEKRNSAKKAIQDYYDLLNLTSETTKSFVATGQYWKENATQIGSKITILGDTPEDIANNQFLVNSLGGIYSNADFEMVYDQEKNDIMVKVSGYEPKRMQDGKLVEGDYREKYISARAWNANVNEGDNFSFISTVPQLVNESLEMMKPADRTKAGNGLGILLANGQFSDKYWSDQIIFRDRINYEGSKSSKKTEEIRQYLNLDKVREDMQSILTAKVKGVNSNVQQAANGWNIDLKKLNEGIENDYQNVQPTEEQYKEALFNQLIESTTTGLVQDEQGRWYKSGSKSIIQPKPKKVITPNIGYRAQYYNNIILGGDNPTQVVLDNMFKIEGPKGRYMPKEEIYEFWLDNEHNKKVANSKSNRDYYKDKGMDPREVFEKLAPKDGLYKIINSKPVYAGDYNFDSAVDRLEFALDNTTQSERKAIENETILMTRARKIDWMNSNPKKQGETDAEYVKRMEKALK
jgi:hypothetical protein